MHVRYIIHSKLGGKTVSVRFDLLPVKLCPFYLHGNVLYCRASLEIFLSFFSRAFFIFFEKRSLHELSFTRAAVNARTDDGGGRNEKNKILFGSFRFFDDRFLPGDLYSLYRLRSASRETKRFLRVRNYTFLRDTDTMKNVFGSFCPNEKQKKKAFLRGRTRGVGNRRVKKILRPESRERTFDNILIYPDLDNHYRE